MRSIARDKKVPTTDETSGGDLLPCTPSRIRTGAAAVRGRCPRPLNDGGRLWSCEPADLIELLDPYPQPDSNRRRRRERAVS